MKKQIQVLARIAIISAVVATMTSAAFAKGQNGAYQTGFVRWRAADSAFAGWTIGSGTTLSNGELIFNPATAVPGSDPYAAGAYYGGNYYTGGSFYVGEATSPEISTSFNFTEAIASWNASTPPGTWIETQFRAQYGTRWSKWYSLGIWASDDSTIRRHSVRLQGDNDGYVAVDTFVSTNKKETTNKFQLKLRLFSVDGTTSPTVRNASTAYSTSAPKKVSTVSAGNPDNWNTLLNVPKCSQMVYLDGGEVWCSPTSTSMVLGFWMHDTGACEPRVRAAVAGVYDWIYDGHGNWPFNTAYAATKTAANGAALEGYVVRLNSLDKAEEFVKAGVPVVMSIAWGKGDITGSTIPSTNGHLLVLVGFDGHGNPIINDPAASTDAGVQVTYLRSEFEPLWLQSSGGTVYLIYPAGYSVPAIP